MASRPEVQWFASLGFTVSFRDVDIDEAGIHVTGPARALPPRCDDGTRPPARGRRIRRPRVLTDHDVPWWRDALF